MIYVLIALTSDVGIGSQLARSCLGKRKVTLKPRFAFMQWRVTAVQEQTTIGKHGVCYDW